VAARIRIHHTFSADGNHDRDVDATDYAFRRDRRGLLKLKELAVLVATGVAERVKYRATKWQLSDSLRSATRLHAKNMEDYEDEARRTLRAALDGDRAAQQILFLQYYDLIASVAWNCWPENLRHVMDRDDLVQEITTRLLQKLHTFDTERLDEFPGWLNAVAKSEILDKISYWRAYQHGRIHASATMPDESGPDMLERICVTHSLPEKPMRRHEAKIALQGAMANLPVAQREAIDRKYFQEQSNDEIAIAMHRSVGAIRELLRRAEENLEKQVGTASRWLSSR
jgi:RNA polymerase sigma factor (sigma-70 family)